MTLQHLSGNHHLLRIYVRYSDRFQWSDLAHYLLKEAREGGLAGGTILRGIAGFGASSVIHEPHLFKLSSDLPIIIEIIDSRERVAEFLKEVEPLLTGALVTEEEIHVQHYSSVPKKK